MKIFVIDLDGTLLSNDGSLSETDVDRLINVQKKGHRIVLATGRNMQEAKPIIDRLKITQYNGAVILADGQYIYFDNEILQRPYIEWSTAQEFCKKVPSNIQVSLTTPDFNYYVVNRYLNPEYFKLQLVNLNQVKNKVITIRGIRGVEKIEKVVIDTEEDSISLVNYKERFEIVYIHDKNRYEIKHKGVNKGETLQILLNNWNESRDNVYVFGNDDNDISLMKKTFHSYSMFNGTETLKRYASFILEELPSVVVETVEKLS